MHSGNAAKRYLRITGPNSIRWRTISVSAAPGAKPFLQLDRFFSDLLSDLRGSDTVLLVTADHGFVDTSAETTIHLENHPQLQRHSWCLYCGEPRLAFCYVHPGFENAFESYVRDSFSDQAALFPVASCWEELVWAGRSPSCLQNRIGQYALVMKDNWVISGRLPGERPRGISGTRWLEPGGCTYPDLCRVLVYSDMADPRA